MRYLGILVYLIIFQLNGELVRGQNLAPCDDLDYCSWSKQQVLKIQKIENQNLEGGIDITFTKLALEIDPNIRFVDGILTTVYKNTKENNLVSFELANEMLIDSLWLNGGLIQSPAVSRPGDNTFAFATPSNNLDRVDTLTIKYRGVPPETPGFGSFVQEFRGNDSIPIIWTLSQPYGARDWWPCRQVLGEKIDSVVIELSIAKPYLGIANGMLTNKIEENNRTIFTYKHNYPIPAYLIAFAATNYSYYEEYVPSIYGDSIKIENYLYPEDSARLRQDGADYLTQQFEIFEGYFGPYPFKKERYGHAQFSWLGGMEHTTISFMYDFNFELMAHELAHSWFGDDVTCASWEDIWLNEGFANWMVGLCYEQLLDKFYWPLWRKNNLNIITSLPGGSVFVEDTSSVSRIFSSRLSYRKGSYVLHMLRWYLGDSVLFTGLRNFLSNEVHNYGFARTSDLIKALELESGENLDWFFDQWVYKEGFPIITSNYLKVKPNEINLKIKQKPSLPNLDPFKLKLPVRLYSANRLDYIDFVFDWEGLDTVLNLKTSFEIDSVAIDPDLWLIAKINEAIAVEDNCIKVYPNPTQNTIKISLCNFLNPNIALRLTDITGKVLLVSSSAAEENEFSIDLSTLESGIYFINITDNLTSIQEKVIKIP